MAEQVAGNARATILVSDPYIFNPNEGRLGETLQLADLVTETQILLALHEQGRYTDLKIGEILALRGWITEKTANFFAESWPLLLNQKSRQPIGYYLKEAGLLTEEQVDRVLAAQQTLWLRFGEIAVRKGWIKQTTLDFFLQHLFPEECSDPASRSRSNDLDRRMQEADTLSEWPGDDSTEVFPIQSTNTL